MKKYFTAFRISKETGYLIDCGYCRYEKEEDCIKEVLSFDYDETLLVLPVYVPTSLQ